MVKPTVSATAAATASYPAGALEARELAARSRAQGRHVMVQPYLSRVEHHGETSLVYLGGRLSHTFRKAALLTSPGGGPRGPVMVDAAPGISATATPAQVAVAEAALAVAPGGASHLTYARVDLVPDGDDRLVVLELTEPSLFLRFADTDTDAADRLAAHLARPSDTVRGRPRSRSTNPGSSRHRSCAS